MVVELVPGDVIRLRLYGQRVSSAVARSIPELYYADAYQTLAAAYENLIEQHDEAIDEIIALHKKLSHLPCTSS